MKSAPKSKKLWNWKTADACAQSGLSGSKPRPSSILSRPSDARRRIFPRQRGEPLLIPRLVPKHLMTGWIAIALGDLTGIGPEVTLKALARDLETDDARYLLIGDNGHVRRSNERLRPPLPLQPKRGRSEEHTSELQSRGHLVCRLLLEKKKKKNMQKIV